jgi:hypothetical protein
MLFIFDIDGTLADLSHRLHFIGATPTTHVQYDKATQEKDWAGFHAACVDDKPIFEVITIARALANGWHTVVYSTGRSEDTRGLTRDWLGKYRLPDYDNIYMRTTGDWREDFVVKSELLDKILLHYKVTPEELGGAFEDRQQVVKMYRERGVKVFQVADGNF